MCLWTWLHLSSLSLALEVGLFFSYSLNKSSGNHCSSILRLLHKVKHLFAFTSRRKFPPSWMGMRSGHAVCMQVDSQASSKSPENPSKEGSIFFLLASKLYFIPMTFKWPYSSGNWPSVFRVILLRYTSILTKDLLLQSQTYTALTRAWNLSKGPRWGHLSCTYPLCLPTICLLDSTSVSNMGLYQLFINKSPICLASLKLQVFSPCGFSLQQQCRHFVSGQFCILIASCLVVS